MEVLFYYRLVSHCQLAVAGMAFFAITRARRCRTSCASGLVVVNRIFQGAAQDVEASFAQIILGGEG